MPPLLTGPAEGAEYHVSTEGSDSNPGTAARPFRTITRAYQFAGPGVTILVSPGVYTDYTRNYGLRLGRSGTDSSPIVLKSQIPGGAIIDGQNGADRHVAIYLNGSYHVVDGFEIRGGPNGGIKIWGNSNRIINNEIHHNGNVASTNTYGKDGVYSNEWTRDNLYAANNIHDNGRPGSNLDHGLYLCGDNEMVINNILARNAGYGLQIAGYATVSNLRVYNNVMAFNGRGGIVLWLSLRDVELKNNILYRNGRYGIDSWDAHGDSVVIDHNLVHGNAAGAYNFTWGGSDYTYTLGKTISTEPRFAGITLAGFDPYLRADSPALNAGLNLSAVFTTDIDGAARPASGAWDVGPYSYGVPDPSVQSAARLTFAATSGRITAPFIGTNGIIQQASSTGVVEGGRTAYSFTITNAGDYIVSALVKAPNDSANSFFVNIDDEPSDPTMIWDVPISTGFDERRVAWRGAGTFERNEFVPIIFTLAAGKHQLIVRGREAGCELSAITIAPYVRDASDVILASELVFNGPPDDATVTWASVPGRTYRVACKRGLGDAKWTDVSGDITATGTSTSWTDQDARRLKQRYYRLYMTD